MTTKKRATKKRGPGRPPFEPRLDRRRLRSRKTTAALAAEMEVSPKLVARERAALGLSLPVGRPRGSGLAATIPRDELRGPETNAALAARYGVTAQAVSLVRRAAGVDRSRATAIEFAERDLLGPMSAVELAAQYGCTASAVRRRRAIAREREAAAAR